MKTPANLSVNELAKIAKKAATRAGREARKAGIKVAGFEKDSLKAKQSSVRVAKSPDTA